MALEPLVGGEEIGDDRRVGLGDAREVAAEGGHQRGELFALHAFADVTSDL